MLPILAVPVFDLQSHSLHSDGHLSPTEVVAQAAQAGVELLALSDHDTVDGVNEAMQAGVEHGVTVVPATEISAVDGEYEDLHVLGYRIDHRDPVLAERLLDARADRERRADAMAAKLRELGFEVDPAPIEARKAAGKPVGRPHLAAAVVEHPANAARLEQEGLQDVSSFIPAYLIQGTPGYVARSHPTVAEAIEWIHDAGGMAIWAHPFWDIKDDQEVVAAIDRYRAVGLDGVEVFYTTHTQQQIELLASRCDELGLLTTGSADFHGPTHRLFSRFRAFELHGHTPELGPIAGGGGSGASGNGHRPGLCLWLTGLSGAGKSTIGRAVERELRQRGHRVEVLDGDVVRRNLTVGLGYSRRDRDVNVGRISFVADLLSRNGVIVIVAAISPYREARDKARMQMAGRFAEVYVRATVDECERRDVKGLYKRARDGEIDEFTGVSHPYEEPQSPEMVVETERESPAESVARVVGLVEQRLGLTLV
jgi:3',5'-nucleoside bisphosphate phosphatase